MKLLLLLHAGLMALMFAEGIPSLPSAKASKLLYVEQESSMSYLLEGDDARLEIFSKSSKKRKQSKAKTSKYPITQQSMSYLMGEDDASMSISSLALPFTFIWQPKTPKNDDDEQQPSVLFVGSSFVTDSDNSRGSDSRDVSWAVSSCAREDLDSKALERSITLPFYYQLETKKLADDGLLTDVELVLTHTMCSDKDRGVTTRRLNDDKSQKVVVAWNSNPKDVLSTDYVCTPSSPEAQFCHVVEGGMTVYFIENESNDKGDEAVKLYAYTQIEDSFSSLIVDDSSVVDISYLGKAESYVSSLGSVPDEPETMIVVQSAEDGYISDDSYNLPVPLIVTLSSALLVTLLVGLHQISRERKKDELIKDDATTPTKPIHVIGDSHDAQSQAQDTVANTTITTAYYGGGQEKVLSTILGENEETRTEWRRFGILPAFAVSHDTGLDGIREEFYCSGSELYDERSV